MYHSPYPSKVASTGSILLRVMDTVQALLIASILGTILIGASAVFASDDSPFYFDESGKMQMNGTWSPISPDSRRTTDQDRRQYNAWSNAETLRKNRELVEEYYSKPSAPPSDSSSANAPYLVFPSPGERPRLCQRSFNNVYCF